MGALVRVAAALVLIIGAAPCFAQSKLTGPIEAIDEPIVVEYGEISGAYTSAEILVDYYKNGEKINTVEERLEATTEAHREGENLAVLMTGYSGASITNESHSRTQSEVRCLMRTTGERLSCDQGKMAFPLLDRPDYKTGDQVTFPSVRFNGTNWDIAGTVIGKSRIGQRPVLVVEFAGNRKDKIETHNVEFEVAGHGYLDLAVGYPLQLELTTEFRAPFADFDRVVSVLRVEYSLPGAQP